MPHLPRLWLGLRGSPGQTISSNHYQRLRMWRTG